MGLTLTIIGWLIFNIGAIFLLQTLIDQFSKGLTTEEILVYFCLGVMGLYLFAGILNFFINLISIKVSYKLERHLSMMVINKLSRLPMRFYDMNNAGEIFNKALSDPTNIQNGMVNFYIELNKAIFGGVFYGIALILLSPYIALIGLALYGLLMSIIAFIFKKSQKLAIKKRQDFVQLNDYMEEMITSQSVIENYGEQDYIVDGYKKIEQGLRANWIKAYATSGVIFPWSVFALRILNVCITVAFLLLSISKIELPGIVKNIDHATKTISFGTLVSLSLVSNLFADLFSTVCNNIQIFISAQSSLRKMNELVQEKEEHDDIEQLHIDPSEGIDVEFKNVYFNYLENKPTLKNVSFVAKRNMKVAIIGPTGSGKTTIVNLINRFYDINQGDITFNGVSIVNKSRNSVRKNISIVLQDTFLFSESILKNVLRGNENATPADVIKACKKAQVHDFIMKYENDYGTILDDSRNLSQGQKQLLTIARAIISDAKIIILDEATSSIDTRTEKLVQKAIENLIHSRTAFVIAHRLSTILNADLILVIKDGEIIGQGNHETLLNSCPFYKELYYANYSTKHINE
ncbi:ABC transporter ATP-binding protein [Ureaplasma canigenitalium]|uniref:ABC transporter ATP-binding protein n=1 Tax=Ureaplasma canigenitalium TaxID=42092 RepID=UPI001FDF858A|nr:ABC transporter ATP-binding protein [Ureaplasma canigenitalium]